LVVQAGGGEKNSSTYEETLKGRGGHANIGDSSVDSCGGEIEGRRRKEKSGHEARRTLTQ